MTPSEIHQIHQLRHALEHFETELAARAIRLNQASWTASVESTDEHHAAVTAARKEWQSYLSDPERRDKLRAFADVDPEDALLARKRDVALRLIENQFMEPALIEELVPKLVEVEASFHNFRAELDGEKVSDNVLKDILRSSDSDREVRSAWLASKQIGPQVADRVREIATLRNRHAHSAGYENFQLMALELDELDPAWLFGLLEDLAELTCAPFAAVKAELDQELSERFGVAPGDLGPWHYGDPFFQSSPRSPGPNLNAYYADQDPVELARRLFEALDLPIDSILERSDLFEREGKCQHAFCTHVDRAGDVRILCNLRSDEEWMSVLLHELGHAIYDVGLDSELPFLLRVPAHTLTTEAIAMLFGRLSRHARFLEKIVGVPREEAERVAASAQEELRRQELIFIRWALVVVFFERELYRNPEGDLDQIWWQLVERFQGIRKPAGRQAPDWATKIHIAAYPVYYQNYILGDLATSQLSRHLGASSPAGPDGGVGFLIDTPATGRVLVESLFHPGKRWPWPKLLEEALGRPFGAEDFAREFSKPRG